MARSVANPFIGRQRFGPSWLVCLFIGPFLFQPVLASEASFDYYEVLGLSREATLADVKKAYRHQALEWHPDKNPGNREEAEVRFRRIAEAYAVLSNGDARQRYDRESRFGFAGGSGGGAKRPSGSNTGRSQRSGSEGFPFEDVKFSFESAEDLFRQFFGHEDPFREAKEQLKKGHDVMMDAIREGEAITTRLGDLLKTFAGEPDAGGGASARAAKREQDRAKRDQDRARRAEERENMKREEPDRRTRDRQARADGRERMREERAQRAEEQSKSQARDAFEKPQRRPGETKAAEKARHAFERKLHEKRADKRPQRRARRDFGSKSKDRKHPEFDFADLMDVGMRAFQSAFQDSRAEL